MLFSLNATATGTVPAPDTVPATGSDTINQQGMRNEMREHWEKMSPKEREQVRNKLKDHWKDMSPEEREASRKEMREHFKNMSPEERKQFNRDLGKQDGAPPADGDYPDNSTGDGDRTAK